MVESIRERIFANVKETLEGIQSESGYFFSIAAGNIRRTVGGIGSVEQSPSLFINVGSEQGATKVHDYTTCTVGVTIESWIRSDKSTLPTDIERLLADIKRVMQVDYTRGGLAIQTDYVGATDPVVAEGLVMWGVIGVQFSILYRTLRTNPMSV